MTSPHQPRRPGWRCADCHDEWPCARRRAELRAEFEGERVRLALHMAGYSARPSSTIPMPPNPCCTTDS